MTKELSIKESLSSKELFESFKLQLKKDLEECGCEAEFVGILPTEFEKIQSQLANVLKHHEKKPGFNIQQLLYRVDINEKQLNERLKKSASEDYLNVVSELIIKRILQKVVLRKYFSK
jgi:hypothetical protein